ncbi:F-box domain containing protein [Rhynchospora pubera]|uniref:F-box domain containing protein n=1 Tax=Rhynchospora pubera TaxID=906938 RepID=A0AAV8BNW8_9POAL|nr:F-box domain containing protein [Rhynchospora pubera]
MTSGEKRSHTSYPSWVSLPPELLAAIVDRLDITSSIRLSAVCTSWATAIRPHLPTIPPLRPDQHSHPWLLLSARNSETVPDRSTDLAFYDLLSNTSFSVPTSIPSLCRHNWLSSNKGWLLTCDPEIQLHLVKPLTGAHILLPFNALRGNLWSKVILHRTPDCAGGFLAIGLLMYELLVFTETGVKRLTASNRKPYLDAVVYEDKLYALTNGTLQCWDLVDSSFKGEMNIICGLRGLWMLKRCLVKWRGGLLMLCMFKEKSFGDYIAPTKVSLYKLNLRDAAPAHLLSPVTSIQDDAVFIGNRYSFVVPTLGLDKIKMRGNCIYFSSDVCGDPKDLCSKSCAFRVFDLGDTTFKPCYHLDTSIHLPPPIAMFLPY